MEEDKKEGSIPKQLGDNSDRLHCLRDKMKILGDRLVTILAAEPPVGEDVTAK